MARMPAAITGKKYFRLLPLVSALVLLTGLGLPTAVFAQQDQVRLDESNDRQDAERQQMIQNQENEKALNDQETENSLRAHQNEIDQRLDAQEMQIQLDAANREAQDRANYQRSVDTARAAAIARQGHEAAKKQEVVKSSSAVKEAPAPAAPAPTTPTPLVSDATAPGQPMPQNAADALIAAPATPTKPMSTEEKTVDDAVAAAIANAKSQVATEAATDAATKEAADKKAAEVTPIPETPKADTPAAVPPVAATPVPVADKPKVEAKAEDKTPPPPLEKTKTSKKSQTINEELDEYDSTVAQQLFDGLPVHSINDISALTALDDKKDTPRLSLNSIVMFALDDNPDVGMAEARKQQAIHNVGRARAALYPHLDMTLEQHEQYNNPAAGKNPTGPFFNPSDRVALTLQQMIYDGNITANTIKQRQQAVKGADFDIDSNTKDVLSTTVQQYLNVLKFQSTLKDNQEFIARLKNIEDIINTTYQMGGSAKNDVEYAESRMAAAESGLENVKASMNDAISNLQSLTGPLPEFIASPPDDLDPERVKLDEYVKLAQEHNNDVLANENDLQQMKYKLKTDKGVFMPRINLVMSGERTYDDGGPTGRDINGKATLQMSYNIFDGFEGKENVKRTQAMISEIEIKRRKIMDDLRKSLRLSYNQMTSLQANISKTKAEISSSQALQDLNRQNFEQGTVSLIELIEGEERLNNANAKLHQQENDLYLSAYKLLLQVGVMKKNFFCAKC